ncbi:MAG: hypothetical protein CMJ58_25980 [Planctomycetaceae bacterium]|nr:hypothetical protein [Planctomycetaceae bacterium]
MSLRSTLQTPVTPPALDHAVGFATGALVLLLSASMLAVGQRFGFVLLIVGVSNIAHGMRFWRRKLAGGE